MAQSYSSTNDEDLIRLPQGMQDLIRRTIALSGSSDTSIPTMQKYASVLSPEGLGGYSVGVEPIYPIPKTNAFYEVYPILEISFGQDAQRVAEDLDQNITNPTIKDKFLNTLLDAQETASRINAVSDESGKSLPAMQNLINQVTKNVSPYTSLAESVEKINKILDASMGSMKGHEAEFKKLNANMDAWNKNMDAIDKRLAKVKNMKGKKISPQEASADIRDRMIAIAQGKSKVSSQDREIPEVVESQLNANSTFVDGFEINTPEKFKGIIRKAAERHKVPTALLSSLLAHESVNWDPRVIAGNRNSPVGAQGVAQFMPATAASLGIDPLDPQQAILGAAKYLRQQYDSFGTWEKALAGYNAGPGAVSKYGGIPPYPETQNYVKDILYNRAPKAVASFEKARQSEARIPKQINKATGEKEAFKTPGQIFLQDLLEGVRPLDAIKKAMDVTTPAVYAAELPGAQLSEEAEKAKKKTETMKESVNKSGIMGQMNPIVKKFIDSLMNRNKPTVSQPTRAPLPAVVQSFRNSITAPKSSSRSSGSSSKSSSSSRSTPKPNATSVSGRSVYIAPRPAPRRVPAPAPIRYTPARPSAPMSVKSGARPIASHVSGKILYSDGSLR